MTMATPMSLGTKERVTSCTWVTACSSETPKPMPRATRSTGMESLAARIIAWRPMCTTSASVTVFPRPSVVALHEGGRDQAPAVDHDEEQQLEGQRDQGRGQHHHAHRHQHRADDDVDDEEGDEDDEPDDERRL